MLPTKPNDNHCRRRLRRRPIMTTTRPSTSRSIQQHYHDVFLIHAGQQKASEVAVMKMMMQDKLGYSCFVDRDNLKNALDQPNRQMQEALQTCRYALVVLSKSFVSRPNPRAELWYAYQRMLWLRQHELWESLWIVLFDMTFEEYKELHQARGPTLLPPLHHDVQLFE